MRALTLIFSAIQVTPWLSTDASRTCLGILFRAAAKEYTLQISCVIGVVVAAHMGGACGLRGEIVD